MKTNRDAIKRELAETLEIVYVDLPYGLDWIADGEYLMLNKAIYRENDYIKRLPGQIFDEISTNVIVVAIPQKEDKTEEYH